MGQNTTIEWTNATWNCIRGCSLVSAGCENCYAMREANRHAGPGRPYEGLVRKTPGGPRWTGAVHLVPEKLGDPLRWRKPLRIFTASMSDPFHPAIPDIFLCAMFGVMSLTPHHIHQPLTKRPERALDWFRSLDRRAERIATIFPDETLNWRRWHVLRAAAVNYLGSGKLPSIPSADPPWPLPNVWVGFSAENQPTFDERWEHAQHVPSAVLWVSLEPLLGPVDVSRALHHLRWVVVGGESGPGARPLHPDWVRSLRDECVSSGVPFFFKQWGAWKPLAGVYEEQVLEDGTVNEDYVQHLLDAHARYENGALEPSGYFSTWSKGNDVQVQHQPSRGAVYMARVGKGKAGALLDGREWREYPEVKASA